MPVGIGRSLPPPIEISAVTVLRAPVFTIRNSPSGCVPVFAPIAGTEDTGKQICGTDCEACSLAVSLHIVIGRNFQYNFPSALVLLGHQYCQPVTSCMQFVGS
eukprot:3206543-Rhodomonas_salina.2